MGLTTNPANAESVPAALRAANVPFDPRPTRGPGHATTLAREAAAERRALVVAAGGDGTVAEVAPTLARYVVRVPVDRRRGGKC